jgi:hypothetical protein
MSNKSKRLGMVVGAFVVLCAIAWNLVGMKTSGASWQDGSPTWSDPSIPSGSSAPSTSPLTYGPEEPSPGTTYSSGSSLTPGSEGMVGCATGYPPTTSSPNPTTGIPATSKACGQSYAVATNRLRGLPPDATPGTRFTLWVSWGPRVTKAPRIQKLIPVVTLERLIPPVVGQGPTTALLAIPRAHLSDMLYADRFGDLAVTLLP